jgi:hypothetical protein
VTGPERSPTPDGTADQQMATPSVSTAPARSGPFSRIPSHLGRARTSTVVLGLLFVSIFALYLTIKPADPGTAAGTTETGTEQPAPAPAPAPATTAPETPGEPTTSDPATPSAPTSTSGPTPEEEPSDTTVPEETSAPTPPTTTTTAAPTTRAGTPTTVSPTG